LAIDVGQGLSGRDVVATLERLRFERGLPQRIYCACYQQLRQGVSAVGRPIEMQMRAAA
jgi:hypothetical protein